MTELLIWPIVSFLCGLALVVQFLMAVFRRSGGARWLAVVPLAASVIVGVLVFHIWTGYRYLSGSFSCLAPCRALTEAATRYFLLGLAAVGVTAVAMMVGVLARRRLRSVAG